MGYVPDVSYWQGVISLATARAWKAAGINDVYVKIGGGDDGIYKDSKHDQTVINLRTAGIRAHHYFFNGGDPTTAANYCASWLGGMIQPGERFGWDIESPAWSGGQEAVAIDRLAALGYGPKGTDHYGSSSTLHNYAQAASRGVDLWVAEYGSNDGNDHGVSTTGPWSGFRMHQFTSNATLPGYGGRLDLSVDGGGSGSGTVQSGWGWINQTVVPLNQIQHAINVAGYQPALVEDNIAGPATEAGIKWFQSLKGLSADGIVGPITAGAMFGGSASPTVVIGANLTSRSTSDIQAKLNAIIGAGLVVDGLFGPATTAAVEAYQKSVGIGVDGLYGSVTDGHLFGSGSATKLVVDGVRGLLTNEAEQHALGVTPDGVRGPQTISAEQRKTGAGVDGQEGPDTYRHLQQYLINLGYGAIVGPADGVFGLNSTKGLQTALNDSRF